MVADVVEGAHEPVHVVSVERCDEGTIQEVDDLVREAVALVLELLDVADLGVRSARKFLEQLDQRVCDRDDIRGGAVVEGEELALLRDKAQACHLLRLFTRHSPTRSIRRPTLKVR